MNAGKSTSLLQSNHNYEVRGLQTYLFTPKVDADLHEGSIHSRLGLEKKAHIFNESFNFYDYFQLKENEDIACILVDEAQFLSRKQVHDLSKVADKLNIPVMCYGIRTDFRGELFEGSAELLALADNLIELKTICSLCNRKATMVVRKDENGNIVTEGSKIVVGGNDIYMPVCRKHYQKLTKLI